VISPTQRPVPDNTQYKTQTSTRRDSNPRSQQASGRIPTPLDRTATGIGGHKYEIRYVCVLLPFVFVYAHGDVYWSIFLRQGHLLRGLEKLYYKFMIVVLDLWRRMLYGLPAKLKRSMRVFARDAERNWLWHLNRIRTWHLSGEPNVSVWVWEAKWAVRSLLYLITVSLWHATHCIVTYEAVVTES
jgi:hypothetical protein